MVRYCGAALGLFAFCVTILLGLTAGNPTEVILLKALQALVTFCLVGLIVGWVAYRVLDEHAMARHRELFPEDAEKQARPDSARTKDTGSGPAEGRSRDNEPATTEEEGSDSRRVAAG